MRAFTIATPDNIPMAVECEKRVLHFCGVDHFDIHAAKDRHEAYVMKLTTWLKYQEPVWFVDADMWMRRPAQLPLVQGPLIIGAPADSPDTSIPRPESFNMRMLLCSSLIGMDMSNQVCRDVIADALYLQEERFPNKMAKYDGWFLNLAATRSHLLMICRLGCQWNWCGDKPPDMARNIHAASRPNKLQWLKANTQPILANGLESDRR